MNNIKEWKTTALGLILILSDLAYLFFVADHSMTIFFGLLVFGVALLFSPDNLISGIKKIIKTNENKKI